MQRTNEKRLDMQRFRHDGVEIAYLDEGQR